MKARLLLISAVAITAACHDTKTPSDASGPPDPSKIISDGAHGGNKDFFFLPPMVPLPVGNADFELGKFNNTLGPAIRIEICELRSENLNAQGLPTATTRCIAGNPLKTFAPGSVNLVNLPLRQNGWWTLFNLPPDGFYYVLWDTRQSNLNVSKYYRIKVLINGATEPLGIADVDPMASLSQWKYTNTGQVIQLVDDVLLPIPFRIEKAGGSTLCGTASLCVSKVISNNDPSGFQTLTVDNGAGAVAGAKFPNGWLPAAGPQNVVVTIASVNIGTPDPVTGASSSPCHAGLPLQQFPGCFNFTTTPHLASINEAGDQFALPVTVAVCYSLNGTGDPREKFAEMYASGPLEPPHALADASDAGILSAATRNCSAPPIITAAPSQGVTQFATDSWRRIKSGVGALFGVKTAYGVDLGLGGIVKQFSNIGPAINADIEAVGPTAITRAGGGNVLAYVRLIGSDHHDGEHQHSVGVGGLPVRFQVAASNGTLAQIGDEIGGATVLDLLSNSTPIEIESPVSGGGYAGVNWQVPSTPGVYHLTVTGAGFGGPVDFAVTVVPTAAAAIESFALAYRGSLDEGVVTFSALLSDEFTHAETFATRLQIDQRAILADNTSVRQVFRELQSARARLAAALPYTPASPPVGSAAPSQTDLRLLIGFAEILAAENWCSGVPTSQLSPTGTMVWGVQQSTQQLLQSAVARFDTVIVTDVSPVTTNTARLGRARALLDLGDWAGATASAALVPSTGDQYNIAASLDEPLHYNGIYNFMNFQKRWTVSDNEGGNGLPYRSDPDLRVPSIAAGLGFDGTTPLFTQQKYPSLTSPTPLAPNYEARLIEAEGRLQVGDLAGMTVQLNIVRVGFGLSPLVPPASLAEARQTLFKERAYTLWLTAHRLGDLRRLIQYYGFSEDEVFPTGEYFKGGVYGTDVSFPIPTDPVFNPTGKACGALGSN